MDRMKTVVVFTTILAMSACTKEKLDGSQDNTQYTPDTQLEDGTRALEHLFECDCTPAYTFYVWIGCNQCYGQAVQSEMIGSDCPGYPVQVLSQNTTGLTTYGFSTESPSACKFRKGASSPFYTIVPDQGGTSLASRKKLRIQFKSGVFPDAPNGCAWFSYDAAANNWNVAAGASAYFNWTIVTAYAPICC